MQGVELDRRITHSALWSTGSALFVQALRFALFVLLARLVSPSEFGVVALALLMVDLLQTMATTGMADALVQKQDLTEEQADTVFWTNLGLGLAATSVVFLAAGPLADAFRAPVLEPVLQTLSVSLVIWPLGAMHTARISRELGFKALAIRNIASNLLGGGVGIALALAGAGVWALVARSLVALIAVVVFAWFAHPWRPKFRFDRQGAPALLRTGGRLMGAQVVSQLGGRGMELVAGALLNPAAVGILRVGGQCVDLLMQLAVAPFYQIALPAMARGVRDGRLDAQVFSRVSRLSATLIYPAFFGAMVVAPDLLPALFGVRYAAAAPVLSLLCLLALPLHLNVLLTPALTSVGRTTHVLAWSVLGAALSLALAALGTRWGLMGLVSLVVGRMYLMLPLAFLWLKRHVGISPWLIVASVKAPMTAAIGSAAVAYLVSRAMPESGALAARLAGAVSAGVIAYVVLLLSLDRGFLRDLKSWRQASQGGQAPPIDRSTS